MRATFLTETGFEIRDIEIPACGENEILIKITACGVCSGDVFVYKNRAALFKTHPRLGHEASGVITGIGKNVNTFVLGDLVTTFGLHAYADYIVTSPKTTVKLPPEIDPILALGEPIACCVHAGNRFGSQPGNRVAVVGCGFMGLICQQIVQYQGANFILSIDPVEERLDIAKSLGANVTINPFKQDADAILNEFGDFDLVIEAVGNQSALDLCTPLVKEHGRIILIGYHQSNQGIRTVNMEQWNLKAIDVVNGHVRREDEKLEAMRQGMAMMAQGHLITNHLVTTYPLTDITMAFSDLVSGKPGLLKAVLLMEPYK
jgi:threonine dehydrogenase-like Zn-dependent dehydrogenase